MKQDDRARLETLAARVDAIDAGTKQVLLQYGLETPDTIAARNGRPAKMPRSRAGGSTEHSRMLAE